MVALIKEMGGSEEFPSGTEGFKAEEETEEIEGFRTLVEGLIAGVSSLVLNEQSSGQIAEVVRSKGSGLLTSQSTDCSSAANCAQK